MEQSNSVCRLEMMATAPRSCPRCWLGSCKQGLGLTAPKITQATVWMTSDGNYHATLRDAEVYQAKRDIVRLFAEFGFRDMSTDGAAEVLIDHADKFVSAIIVLASYKVAVISDTTDPRRKQ